MRKSYFFLAFMLFIFFSFNVQINSSLEILTSPEDKRLQNSEKISPEEAPYLLIGEWIIAARGDLKPGLLSVKDERYYIMTRNDEGSIGVTFKGEYTFNVSKEPFAIDFCIGECGKPGSEWTTQVGILRFISKDEMEIQFGPDGKRLTQFEPKDNDYYFLRLSRKEADSSFS